MENLKDFVERLSESVGCYYHLCEKAPQYSLKKYNTDKPKEMGVFGWVLELKRKNMFEICTYKYLGDATGVSKFSDKVKPGYIYVSRHNDPDGKGKGLVFYCYKGSIGEDYQKAVKALRAIMEALYKEKRQAVTTTFYDTLSEIQSVVTEIKKAEKPSEEITPVSEQPIREHISLITPVIEIQPKKEYLTEETKTEQEGTLKLSKPYKKKTPTEEKPIKSVLTEMESSPEKQKKSIYLGNIQKGRRKITEVQKVEEFQSKEAPDKKVAERALNERLTFEIAAPFVKLDIDETKVCLVLPQNQLGIKPLSELPQWVTYKLTLNGKQQDVSANIKADSSNCAFVEEKLVCLEEPPTQFQIIYPVELQSRDYAYIHNEIDAYIFSAMGNNQGRMHYLYDEGRHINPISKKKVWILLEKTFELETEPEIEEKWIWGKYRSFLVDLSSMNVLGLRNSETGKKKSISLQSTFRIEGKQIIEDDFTKECPLFIGKDLKIVAPVINDYGWNVWIQNKIAGFKIKENWTGEEPLLLNNADDLPCEYGEFQIDICEKEERIPSETIFFRLLPFIELYYPKKLVIPESGHSSSIIQVILDNTNEWELKIGSNQVKPIQGNLYRIELLPQKYNVQFSVTMPNHPESAVNIRVTVPRLMWKISKQENWSSKILEIERKNLQSGNPCSLQIRTNDLNNIYNISAILESDAKKLQEGKFKRNGIDYVLELNQFYDTIKQNKGELILKVHIQGQKYNKSAEVLIFKPATICCKQNYCTFETRYLEEIMIHFKEQHVKESLEHLSYEEITKYYETLPRIIYKCDHCNFIECSDGFNDPKNIVLQHIMDVHHQKTKTIEVFNNVEIIRQTLCPNLPYAYKCKLCKEHFVDYSEDQKVEHFVKNHENIIFKYME